MADVARRTGLQLSTARFHLDGLVADGLADRTVEERATPGRRRVLYARRLERSGPRSYGLLAEMLVGLVATVASPEAAVETGRDWGRRLVRRPASTLAVDTDGAVAPLLRMLDDLGFRPEERTADGRPRLLLRHCPFREVATLHREALPVPRRASPARRLPSPGHRHRPAVRLRRSRWHGRTTRIPMGDWSCQS